MSKKYFTPAYSRHSFRIIQSSLLILFSVSVNAQLMFQKTYGGNLPDEGTTVIQTADHGYIIGGRTMSFGAGSFDVYLLRLDSTGDTLWTKAIGGANAECGTGFFNGFLLKQTADHGLIIGTSTASAGAGNHDQCLIRTDSMGNIQWTKVFGGTNYDYIEDVIEVTGGGYIIAGQLNDGVPGDVQASLIRTDANGDTLWTKKYGGTISSNFEIFYCVRQTTDGGFIASGSAGSYGAGSQDLYLVKTDANGNVTWSKTFGGSGWDECWSVRQTSDGGYILLGTTGSFGAGQEDNILLKTDANGNLQWAKTYGCPYWDRNWNLEITSDGGYVVAGSTISYGGAIHNNYNALLFKTNSIGDTVWTMAYGGPNQDDGYGVKETADGGFILVGLTDNFGTGGRDVYLVKTDATGHSGCYESPGLLTITIPNVSVSSGCVVTRGITMSNFAPTGVPTTTVDTTLCSATLSIGSQPTENALSIFPNPAENHFYIETGNQVFGPGKIFLYDIEGKLVLQEEIFFNGATQDIDIEKLDAGIYLIKVQTENGEMTRKIVKR